MDAAFSLSSAAQIIGYAEAFGITGNLIAGWLSDVVFRGNRVRPVVLSGVLAVLFLVSFSLGRYGVPPLTVVKILWTRFLELFTGRGALPRTWTEQMEIAVVNIRLPRILMACLVGCSLSAAGAAFQGVFHNPMASPDILGASSGAAFGAPWPSCWGRPPG